MINKNFFKILGVLFVFFLITNTIHAAADTDQAIVEVDQAGRRLYRYHGRLTYLNVTDEENVRDLGYISDVLSSKDIAEAENNYGSAAQKAKILIPFAAGVMLPLAATWHRSSQSLPSWVGETIFRIGLSIEIADIRSFWTHMVADHVDVNNKDFPLALRGLSLFFQDHHIIPGEIRKASYWYVSRLFYLIDCPILLVTTAMTMGGYESAAAIIALSSLVFAQNQAIHAHVHNGNFGSECFSKFMCGLQSIGLIISHKLHEGHHKNKKHSEGYSIVTGHAEGLCNRIFPNLIPSIEIRFQGFLEKTARGTRILTNAAFAPLSFVKYAFGCRSLLGKVTEKEE